MPFELGLKGSDWLCKVVELSMQCCGNENKQFKETKRLIYILIYIEDGNARFTIVPLKPCVYFCEFLHCFFITRNALVTLPQMKINSLKKQND